MGTWLLGGQPFLTLAANGTGTMEDGKLKWSVEGKMLVITDDEDGVDKAQYQVSGDTLTLTMGGVPLQLTRAGKGVKVEKAGKRSKAMNKQSEPDDDEVQAPPVARSAAPTRGAAGNDQLSQLLMSSAWCWLKYASGNTYQERIVFSANGTWSSNKESEIYGSNQYAGTSAHAVGASGSQGQWTVKGGQLYLSDPPETPQLVPVPLQLTQNSNGAPIITADGKEYSRCN